MVPGAPVYCICFDHLCSLNALLFPHRPKIHFSRKSTCPLGLRLGINTRYDKGEITQTFKALKEVGEGVSERIKRLKVAVKATYDAQLKELEELKFIHYSMRKFSFHAAFLFMCVQSLDSRKNLVLFLRKYFMGKLQQ